MHTIRRFAALVVLPALAGIAHAAPEFDRPGIPFAPTTVDVGRAAWEQGIPDFAYDDSGAVEITAYGIPTLIRYGLAERLELQFGTSLHNRIEVETPFGTGDTSGHTDATLGVKYALPRSADAPEIALKGGLILPTGDDALTADEVGAIAEITAQWRLADNRSFSLFGGAELIDNSNTITVAAQYGFPLNERVNLYIEAGIGSGDLDATVAGGGITWFIRDNVQLDAHLLGGLGDDTPDLQGGLGFSVYFD